MLNKISAFRRLRRITTKEEHNLRRRAKAPKAAGGVQCKRIGNWNELFSQVQTPHPSLFICCRIHTYWLPLKGFLLAIGSHEHLAYSLWDLISLGSTIGSRNAFGRIFVILAISIWFIGAIAGSIFGAFNLDKWSTRKTNVSQSSYTSIAISLFLRSKIVLWFFDFNWIHC